MKFRTRLAWFGTGAAALTVIVFGFLLIGLARRSGPDDQDAALLNLAERTAASLQNAPAAAFQGPVLSLLPIDIAAGTETFVAVLDGEGTAVFSTGQAAGSAPSLSPEQMETLSAEGVTGISLNGAAIRLALVPFERSDIDLAGAVIAGQSTALLTENLRALRTILVVAGIITIIAAWVGAWLVSKRALEPLRQLAITATGIARTGDLGSRLEVTNRRRDEVADLASGFNRMLDRLSDQHRRLEATVDQQRQFIADASHELRNPLATIRSNLDFLERATEASEADRIEALAHSHRAALRMSHLIDDLLRLARLEADSEAPSTSRVNVGEALREAASRCGFPGSVVVDSGAAVLVDREDLIRLLANLMTNATNHGAPPYEATATMSGSEATVTFGDGGFGVDQNQLERIFDRFYRVDEARSSTGGTGLGLPIARALAVRYGGTLVASNRPGGGLLVTLRLPAA